MGRGYADRPLFACGGETRSSVRSPNTPTRLAASEETGAWRLACNANRFRRAASGHLDPKSRINTSVISSDSGTGKPAPPVASAPDAAADWRGARRFLTFGFAVAVVALLVASLSMSRRTGATTTPGSAKASARVKVAVLPFDFEDDSMEGQINGPKPSEQSRVKLVTRDVEKALAASGRYHVITTADRQDLIEKLSVGQALHMCHGCELNIGEALGADWVLVGWVTKTSNLILTLSLFIEDVHTSKVVKIGDVQIRSNTDRSWSLGFRYMLSNMDLIPAREETRKLTD